MIVITPKHVGAVLLYILILLLQQSFCASVGDKKFDILNILVSITKKQKQIWTSRPKSTG
jgi:hypothetical protein